MIEGRVQVKTKGFYNKKLEPFRLFFTSKEVNWNRVWVVSSVLFIVLYFGSCAAHGYGLF